jgi:hypothetical protein
MVFQVRVGIIFLKEQKSISSISGQGNNNDDDDDDDNNKHQAINAFSGESITNLHTDWNTQQHGLALSTARASCRFDAYLKQQKTMN